MTAIERRRANVNKQLAWQQRQRLRGIKLVRVWADPNTVRLWRKLHPLYGGTRHAFMAALRALDQS